MSKVGIIMGSKSDLPVMNECIEILKELEINIQVNIVSAHRTPELMYEYSKNAEKNGIEIIVAGAGGAAHLPGMVASLTDMPVIGGPIKSKNLKGLDSLLSIVQMPNGIPVATVAINGGKNAGLLAGRILSLRDEKIKNSLKRYRENMRDEVLLNSEVKI